MDESHDSLTRTEEELIYDILQEKAGETIRELSGRIWTDYAIHDPGITTLDIANYALSELDYQLKFPLEQYLAEADNRFDPETYGLFGPRRVFPMNPVTPEDYRNMLLDVSDNLLDVQIHPLTFGDKVSGWLDLWIELSSFITEEQRARVYTAVREEVEKQFHKHRNLGEGLRDILLIRRQPLRLVGTIDIDGSLSPEKTLIAIYAEAIKLFAPGSHYTGEEMPIYKLFKGIKEIPGIQSIQSLEFEGFKEGGSEYTLSLTSPEDVKIQLLRNRRPVEIDLRKVLNRLHSLSNIRHAIRDPKRQEAPVIEDTRHIHLDNYSVFNDFPICYKDSATDSFKAYLAVFDHLFSEGQKEINHLQDWMSLDMDLPASPPMRRNKDLLLDTLDKLYAENSNLPFLRLADEDANRRRRVRFLRQLPELTRDRYVGIDLLDPGSTSGLERYMRAILGWEREDERIYVVENLLLFPPASDGKTSLPGKFALSVIIPRPEPTDTRPDFSLRLDEFLRERIPAHLRYKPYWLPPGEMILFRQYYDAWRKAWAGKDTAAIYWLGDSLADHLTHIDNQTQN